MLTYYMVENMALSTRMTPQEQELRNVVEFHYLHRFFKHSLLNEEEKAQAANLIAQIQKLNDTYSKFKQVEKLL
jgi:superoxide dismutase